MANGSRTTILRYRHINIPPFMRFKDQLDPDEEEETRQIAAVQIHVESAIERIRTTRF